MVEIKEYYLKRDLLIDGIEAFNEILNSLQTKKIFILKKYFLGRCLQVLEIKNKKDILKKNFIALLEIYNDENVYINIEKYYDLISTRRTECLTEEIFANYVVDLNTCNIIYCGNNPYMIVHHDCETLFVIKRV